MESLNWGILGTARVTRHLVPAFAASPTNRLVAVASRSRDRVEEYAEQWGIEKRYASYADLLADPYIDAVYIPLPNHMHARWALRAAEAGKHVLCEKPLALTREDVTALQDAATRYSVTIAEAFMYRHHPRTIRVKQLVQQGAIGELHMIRGAFTFTLDRPEDVRWIPEWGGGGLWDVGCYPVSFARYAVGHEPTRVYGEAVMGPTGVDVSFTGSMRFPGDVLMTFDAGIRSPFRMEMTFVGSTGTLHVPRAFKPGATSDLYLQRGDDVETISVEGPELLYQAEIEDVSAAVLEGHASRLTLADSLGNAKTLIALHQSAQTKQPVQL